LTVLFQKPMPSVEAQNVPIPSDRIAITCFHCGKPQEVGRKAMSVTCKFCSKSLKIENIKIKDYQARRVIETIGHVTVEPTGIVFCDRLQCDGLIVRGKLKGTVVSRGPVTVAPEADLKGDVTATSIQVGPGAILQGKFQIGKKHFAEQQAPPA
jgi:hypothetical protein